MDGTVEQRLVLVVAQHSLVGEAVGQALRATGLRTRSLDWESPGEVPLGLLGSRARGLLLAELTDVPTLTAACRWLEVPVPEGFGWVVLSGAEKGPAWGAVLAAGARDVLPVSTGLDDVLDLLTSTDPRPRLRRRERAGLIDLWEKLSHDSEERSHRLQSLSPRERQVLAMLHRGQSVDRIARSSGVSTATVRSQVKAVLRKLGVSSQLAAVALYDHELSVRLSPPA